MSSSGPRRRAIRRAGGVDRRGGRSAEAAEGRSAERVTKALRHLHPDQLVLNPDCGFAPSSVLPIQLDEPHSKLRALGLAADQLRRPHPSRFVMELAGSPAVLRCTRADDDRHRSARRPVRRRARCLGAAGPGAAVSVPLAASPTDGPGAAGAFRGLVLLLRGRTGLTQREWAARLGVHVHSVQAWETGVSRPGPASLRALIAAGLGAGGFTAGREAGEAEALWGAAARGVPFDRAWFDGLLAERGRGEAQPDAAAPEAAAGAHHWGEAPDVAGFLGRAGERAAVRGWVLDPGCRLVTVLGIGGVGKTLLAARVARDVAADVGRVYWRSLRDAPTPADWLAGALAFLDPDRSVPAEGARLDRLLGLLAGGRCLLVLDNFETVLAAGERTATYRAGYEAYGRLLEALAETPHRSCALVTSREEPPDVGLHRGEGGAVRSLHLAGLPVADARAMLSDKRLRGGADAWATFVDRYAGNGLALKIAAETVAAVFGGDIAAFLEYAAATYGGAFGGIRRLLDAQVDRLSPLEQRLLRWLAVEREPVGLAQVAADLGAAAGRGAALDAVEGLRRRSLLEAGEEGSTFTLQSAVLEHVTERLIEEAREEIVTGALHRLVEQPLVKATATDHVRRSQERLLAAPVLEQLVDAHGGRDAAERRLVELLGQLRGRPVAAQGYAPGNLVNLLRLLCGDLRGRDLGGVAIRQAFLQETEAQDASLAGSHVDGVVFGQPFHHPTSVAFVPDGPYLAAGTSTGELYQWRVTDRALVATLQAHDGATLSVAAGAGGLVASAGHDGTVRLWRPQTGRVPATLRGHDGAVCSVALSLDGRVAATGGVDGAVRLWDTETELPLATLKGHAGTVYAVALSADARWAASGGVDGAVRVWDVASRRPIAVLSGHDAAVRAVALSADGAVLLSGGEDGVVRVWAAQSGRPRTALFGHDAFVMGVGLSADGWRAVSGGIDGTVRLWDVEHGRLASAMTGNTGLVLGVALSDDGLVASAGADGTVRLWAGESGRQLAILRGDTRGVVAADLSADGKVVAVAGLDGTVRVWDAESGRLLVSQRHEGGVLGVALSADGGLVASGGNDRTVHLADVRTGRSLADLTGHEGVILAVAMSADGRLVASGAEDRTIRLWATDGGRPIAVLRGHTGGVRGVALSGDARLLVSGGTDDTVRLWDTASGRLVNSLRGNTAGVWGVALSGDGRLVASGGEDGLVRLWRAGSGRPLTLRDHTREPCGLVALSRDGRLLASSGLDGTVRLWETDGGRLMATLRGHTGPVRGLAVSADGRLVASGSVDGTVQVWDVGTGAPLRTLRAERRYERLDITGLTGVTDAQRAALLALGATDRAEV